MENRRGRKQDDKEVDPAAVEKKEAENTDDDDEEDVWQPDDAKPATFAEVYSDSDVSEEEER